MAQTFLAVAASSWAVLMGIAPLLQIRRMLRQRSSQDVSVAYFAILLVGFALWIAYGTVARMLALVIPNTVALLIGTVVVTVALFLRRQPRTRPAGAAGAVDGDGQDSPAGVPDDQPAGIQSPIGSVVRPTSIRWPSG